MSDLVVRDTFDREAVLRAVGLNVADPNAQALLLVCERYGLDPLLKHMVLIQHRPYVTRDGYLHIAHESHQLDGIETVEEGETPEHWWARVSVFRKDMSRPFTYKGRYPKSGGNKTYGPEMAIKCAEVAALRRAFNVTGIGAADERWEDNVPTHVPAARERVAELRGRVELAGAKEWAREQDFVWPWSNDACDAIEAHLSDLEDYAADVPEDAEVVVQSPLLGEPDGTEPF